MTPIVTSWISAILTLGFPAKAEPADYYVISPDIAVFIET